MKIAWIGSGKISKAFFKPLDTLEGFEVSVYSRRFEAVKELEHAYALKACEDIETCVKAASMIVLAVKPNMIQSVLSQLKPHLTEDTLLVSLAAGISLNQIHAFSNHGQIARLMPSTAVSIQQSSMALCPSPNLSAFNLTILQAFFSHFGQIMMIDESLMNAFIASSGSGIAYVYAMIEAMIKESQACGFNEQDAKDIILKTFTAATQMAQMSPLSLDDLMQQVASKGGTTEAGLLQLKAPLQSCVHATYVATLLKAKDLSK